MGKTTLREAGGDEMEIITSSSTVVVISIALYHHLGSLMSRSWRRRTRIGLDVFEKMQKLKLKYETIWHLLLNLNASLEKISCLNCQGHTLKKGSFSSIEFWLKMSPKSQLLVGGFSLLSKTANMSINDEGIS